MKNYKNIRQKPYLYGFSVKGFFFFAIGCILSLLILFSGFTMSKFILVIVLCLVSALIGKIFLSNNDLINNLINNKLPKKYSDYE